MNECCTNRLVSSYYARVLPFCRWREVFLVQFGPILLEFREKVRERRFEGINGGTAWIQMQLRIRIWMREIIGMFLEERIYFSYAKLKGNNDIYFCVFAFISTINKREAIINIYARHCRLRVCMYPNVRSTSAWKRECMSLCEWMRACQSGPGFGFIPLKCVLLMRFDFSLESHTYAYT